MEEVINSFVISVCGIESNDEDSNNNDEGSQIQNSLAR
jgi:hypothetical protein